MLDWFMQHTALQAAVTRVYVCCTCTFVHNAVCLRIEDVDECVPLQIVCAVYHCVISAASHHQIAFHQLVYSGRLLHWRCSLNCCALLVVSFIGNCIARCEVARRVCAWHADRNHVLLVYAVSHGPTAQLACSVVSRHAAQLLAAAH
jgi:hypothetical protein